MQKTTPLFNWAFRLLTLLVIGLATFSGEVLITMASNHASSTKPKQCIVVNGTKGGPTKLLFGRDLNKDARDGLTDDNAKIIYSLDCTGKVQGYQGDDSVFDTPSNNFGTAIKPNLTKDTSTTDSDCSTENLDLNTYVLTTGPAPDFCHVKVTWDFSNENTEGKTCTFDMSSFDSGVRLGFINSSGSNFASFTIGNSKTVSETDVKEVDLDIGSVKIPGTTQLGQISYKCG